MATPYNNGPFIWSNRFGIPRLEATGVTVTTTAVTYSFQPHRFLNTPYSGLILFKLPAYTAPATAVPIVFNTNGTTQALTTANGEAITSAEVSGAGIYLAYYENGTLQLLTGI